ncbi:MAG: hypothetical protein RBU23_06685 [Candidatus Auribacterota bacterium]|jgi:hypothetical protein|nr:hypothetical protein [Candidatus Auribacterota bacterium]
MAEAKNNVNSEVTSVKKEEQIVQRIVELLNERGYEYERDARPIIYWKYDVKSSRELKLAQKEEVLRALENGEFEKWGLEYKTQVLDKQMDIVKEIEKMQGAPAKIELDTERNVAIATEEKTQPSQDDAQSVAEKSVPKQVIPAKISLKKTDSADKPSGESETKDADQSDKKQPRLLSKKEDSTSDQKKKLIKSEQIVLDVKPSTAKKKDAPAKTDVHASSTQTPTADAIMNKIRGAGEDDPSLKTHVAPAQDAIKEKIEEQTAQEPLEKASIQPDTLSPSQTVDIIPVEDEQAQQVKYKARRYSKKDQLTVNTDNETPVGMELSEAERIVQNKFAESYDNEPVSIVSVAMLVLSLSFLGISVYTNIILLMNKDIPAWLANICGLFS